MADIPHDVIEVFDASHLQSVLNSAEFGVGLSESAAERLLSVCTEQRRDIICTTWDGFCNDNFGRSDGLNRFAVAPIDYEWSSAKGAWLTDTDRIEDHPAVVVQQGWLDTGDGRKTPTERIDMTEGNESFDGWDDIGMASFPKDYVFIAHVDDEVFE